MLIPHAIETKGGYWIPVVVHTERKFFPGDCNERLARRVKSSQSAALAHAENVICGRLAFGEYAPSLLAASR